MISSQLILPLAAKLAVDLFAGGGGASTGIEQAIGRHVDIAINHSPKAVAQHRANHPQTRHYVTDVWEVDPVRVCEGRAVGLLWASPDCRHFSPAKGGAPVSDRVRSLAWVVIKWATRVQPDVIFLENIPEFRNWGPVVAGRPCPDRKGKTFRRFVGQLQRSGPGYDVEIRELKACDYNTPTIRKRLFLVAKKQGTGPIVWPEPTNGPGLKPYRTAAECIDWTIPCPSIFDRPKPLAHATERRIAHGLRRYVIETDRPFIAPIAHAANQAAYIARIGQTGGNGKYCAGVGEPLSTITTKAEHLLVAPTLVQTGYGEREGQAPRSLDLAQPLGTVVACGQKHALVASFLAKHYGGNEGPGIPLDGPVSTITTQDHHHLVASTLVKLRGTSNSAAANEPLHTVSAGGWHHAEVRAFLVKYYGTQQDPDLREPLHTVPTKDRFGLVLVHGDVYTIVDIGMRMLQPHELYRAQGFPLTYVIDHGYDERGRRIALTKTEQVKHCGNSVCPPVAAALVRANYAEQQLQRAA